MAPQITCHCGACKKCRGREYMREWSRANADQVRETARASRDRRIEAVRAYDRSRGRARPGLTREKERAREAVREAVQRGDIVKGPCERSPEAECRGRIEAHHEDYSQPLDV